MSYRLAMEMAGAQVHEFEEFGSYQGDWWAKVTYKGRTGWVNGSYGSCEGCDAFKSEFDYKYHECQGDDEYIPIFEDEHTPTWHGDFRDGCETCQDIKARFIAFGQEYLEFILSQEEAETSAAEDTDWDMDAQAMVDFIRAHSLSANQVTHE